MVAVQEYTSGGQEQTQIGLNPARHPAFKCNAQLCPEARLRRELRRSREATVHHPRAALPQNAQGMMCCEHQDPRVPSALVRLQEQLPVQEFD